MEVWLIIFVGVVYGTMAERRLRALRNNRQLARYVLEGRATGKQLGTGSYGSVEEVRAEIQVEKSGASSTQIRPIPHNIHGFYGPISRFINQYFSLISD